MSNSDDRYGGRGSGGGDARGARPRLTQRLPQRDPNLGVDPRTGDAWSSDGYTQEPYSEDPQTQDGYRQADWHSGDHDPRTGAPEDMRSYREQQASAAARGSQQPGQSHPSRFESYVPEPVAPHQGRLTTGVAAEPRARVLSAPARGRGGSKDRNNAPIVEAGSVTGRSLTLVIAIMCFLASLTAGAVYLMNQSASAWLRDIASEVTVQIEAKEKTDIDKRLRDVSVYLAKQPGVTSVKPLSLETSNALLEPWLGSSEVLKSLPVPRLIAIEIDRVSPPDLVALKARIAQQFENTTLDDHRHWQQQIRTVTRSFALGGLSILVLVAAATMAIIVSATRSALAANREIVEVLHFVGATDKFIAREFEKHFLRLGVKAGIFGALMAALIFIALPFVMELLGGGTVSLAELQRLVGTGTLDTFGYGWLAVVVIAIAAICMLTSRMGVKRILHSQE